MRSRFNEMGLEILRPHEFSRNNLELREWSIRGGGMGLFTTTSVGDDTLIGYYYGTLVHGNLSIGTSNRLDVYDEASLDMIFNPILSNAFDKWRVVYI